MSDDADSKLSCKKCSSEDIKVDVGSASGRRKFTCVACGHNWPEKNLAAAELGRLGGKKRVENQTPQERSESAAHAVNTRWRKHKLDQNKKIMS